jgi:hypothetical protein
LALVRYEGPGRQLITQLKYRHRRDAVPQLGRGLAELIRSAQVSVDAITWIPALPAHIRERGFDQGRELAVATARASGVPAVQTLIRRVAGGAGSRSPCVPRLGGVGRRRADHGIERGECGARTAVVFGGVPTRSGGGTPTVGMTTRITGEFGAPGALAE